MGRRPSNNTLPFLAARDAPPSMARCGPARTSVCGRFAGPTRLPISSEIHPASPAEPLRASLNFLYSAVCND